MFSNKIYKQICFNFILQERVNIEIHLLQLHNQEIQRSEVIFQQIE